MSVAIEGGTSAALADVGVPGAGILGSNFAQLVQPRPIAYGSLGHYRVAVRFATVNTQAANSRLFELRNTSTNRILLTRLRVLWLQTGAHTAAIEDSLDCFKLTTF